MKMKPLQHIEYSRWPLYFCTLYCVFILELITPTRGSFKNNTFAWMSPRDVAFINQSKPLEIFCTIDWPILIAARVTNTKACLSFQTNLDVLSWPHVTSTNETTIRLCLDEGYRPEVDKYYDCSLIITKIKLQSTSEKTGGWKTLGEDFDSQFEGECQNELSRGDSNFRYLLSEGSAASSICSEGLQRVRNNDYLNIVNNLKRELAKSENEYQLVELEVGRVDIKSGYRNGNYSISSGVCNSPRNNEYAFPFELITWYIAERIQNYNLVKITSSSIRLKYSTNLGNLSLAEQLANLTCEAMFRSEGDYTNWHPLSCHTEKFENTIRIYILFNATKLESNTKYFFRFRIKPSTSYSQYLPPYFVSVYQTVPRKPKTSRGLFQIFHRLDKPYRDVTIYWRPKEFCKPHRNIAYEIEVVEIDAKGNWKPSDNVLRNSNTRTNWQAKYLISNSGYVFAIRALNSEGAATKASLIYIPAAKVEVNSNISLYSINYENNTAEYFWQLPKNQQNIDKIIFFWYWSDEYLTDINKKNDTMKWKHLPPDVTNYSRSFDYNIRDKSFHSFIGINTINSSSGLIAPVHTIFPTTRSHSSVKPTFIQTEVRKATTYYLVI